MTFKIPLPPFDTATLGSVASCRPDINSRLLHGFLLQVIGTGSPTAAEYIEYVLVNQDDKQKLLLKPALQRLMDGFNSTYDTTLPTDFMYIPLSRPGLPWSPWGTGDISRLSIQAKIAGTNPGGKTLTKIQGWYGYTPVSNPQPRGDVFLQSVISAPAGVGGWNTLADIEVKDIITATRMLFNAAAVTEIRISVGERVVFNMTRAAAFFAMQLNPMYTVPSGAATFPVMLDDLGLASDFIPLVESGVRRPLNVEYYWDTGVTGTPVAFDILVEGVERGAPAPAAGARA